jgi:hypothetical protein
MDKNNYVSASSNDRALTPTHLERIGQSTSPVIVVDGVFTPQATVKETTGPLERSYALVVRLLPVTAIYLVFSITIAIAFEFRMVWGLLIFAALTWLSYYTLDAAERYDSATGVEHHRIDAAKELASQKMEYDAQLRREITAAYLKQLEGPHDPKAEK